MIKIGLNLRKLSQN